MSSSHTPGVFLSHLPPDTQQFALGRHLQHTWGVTVVGIKLIRQADGLVAALVDLEDEKAADQVRQSPQLLLLPPLTPFLSVITVMPPTPCACTLPDPVWTHTLQVLEACEGVGLKFDGVVAQVRPPVMLLLLTAVPTAAARNAGLSEDSPLLPKVWASRSTYKPSKVWVCACHGWDRLSACLESD